MAKLLTAYFSLKNRVRVGEKKSFFQKKTNLLRHMRGIQGCLWECFGQERKISSKIIICKGKSGLYTVLCIFLQFKKGQPGACSAGRAITKQSRVRPSHTWQLET